RELYNQEFKSRAAGAQVEVNSTPAVANGKVYFGTREEFYCIGKKGPTSAARPAGGLVEAVRAPVAEAAHRAGAASAGGPAHVRVVRADVELAPGGTTSFTVRLFDKDGNFVKESPAEWSLPLPPKAPTGAQPPALKGDVKDGRLTVARDLPG